MESLVLSTSVSVESPQLALRTLPRPQLVNDDDLLIRVEVAGIQPSDVVNYKGNFPYTTFPRIIGRDFSGVVVQGPKDIVGREVFGSSGRELSFTQDGSHSQFVRVNRQSVALKPSSISHKQAAVMGVPYSTAQLLLERTEAKAGQVIAVIGCNGSVGSAVLHLARAKGLQVIGVARRNADVSLDDDPEMKGVSTLRDGKGPHIILETTGSLSLMEKGIACLGPHSTFAWISAPKNGQDTRLMVDMLRLYRLEIKLVGCNSLLYSSKDVGKQLYKIVQLLEGSSSGLPDVSSHQTISLSDAVLVYQKLAEGDRTKYIILPWYEEA